MELNEVQFKILDSLYFVEPFDNVVAEVGLAPAVIRAELKTLISHRLVQVMKFQANKGDFVSTPMYDGDNIHDCYFLATKEGLMKHHGY
jgi:hypothetical protein